MNKRDNLRTVYNFRNTCQNCSNNIDFPLLGDFAEGEVIFQTRDGKDFYIAVLIGNKTLDFIKNNFKQEERAYDKEIFSQKALALLADKVNGKEFTTDYPICPICRVKLKRYGDDIRTDAVTIGYVSWNDFERLSQHNKIERISKVIHSLS